MEKEQPDSLATVTVGGKEIPPPTLRHYAPSEVYSTSEPPPAYMRPGGKSTAVQIARIAALTLIGMSVVLGSFILASSYVQARASCTPEAIAALKAEMRLEQHEKQIAAAEAQAQGEFIKNLQPEALIRETIGEPDVLQSVKNTLTDNENDLKAEKKDNKIEKIESNKNSDNDNDNDEEDDYDDEEFPPVHIKLPLQLDLDDIAGTIMQQSRSRVSCVVERKRDEDRSLENNSENTTDPQRLHRLSGERVAIFCESGNPQQEAQDQDMMTPIIVPLGTVQIPLNPQDSNPFAQFQIHTQYQVPDMQQLPLADHRGQINNIPAGLLPPAFRGFPQITVDMRPPRMGPQPGMIRPEMEMRQIPMDFRNFPMDPMRGMRQEIPQQPQEYQQPPMMQPQREQTVRMFRPEEGIHHNVENEPSNIQFPHSVNQQQQREQQTVGMMPPRKELPVMINVNEKSERPQPSGQGIPIEIRRIIQQVPTEIKNIIQHITGSARPFQIPEAPRREVVHEFKPFPEGARPIPLGPFPLPVEIRNLLEHGNVEGRREESNVESSEEEEQQRREPKPFPGPEDQGEEAEKNFPVPVEVRNLIHQVVQGRAFPIPRFQIPLIKPAAESIDIPMEARAEVTEDHSMEELSNNNGNNNNNDNNNNNNNNNQRREAGPLLLQPQQESENRPHYVQPRSVRSVPEEPFAHHREKRMRRCNCDCAC